MLATEAAITLPWDGHEGSIPALTSGFFEFITHDGRCQLAHQLSRDTSYRVVITTFGGLYRYDMGDQVRCVGHLGDAPRLIFEGRAAVNSDMVGEKLDDAFVSEILRSLAVPAALVPQTDPRPNYELWLDCGAPVDAAVAVAVDVQLCANPHYAYARRIGQLGQLVPRCMPGWIHARSLASAAAGQRLGDFKPVSLLADSAI